MSNEYKYTEYCTVFWFEEKNVYHVWTWDELKDRPLRKYRCKTRQEADSLINDYINHAPDDVICHNLMRPTQPRKETTT